MTLLEWRDDFRVGIEEVDQEHQEIIGLIYALHAALGSERAGVRVEEFAANRIKQSLTGHGHAGKVQMQRAIQSQFNLSAPPEPPDVADAIAVALCCGRNMTTLPARTKLAAR